MSSIGRMTRAAVLIPTLSAPLSSCMTLTDFVATKPVPAEANASVVACQAFRPIAWSNHDTDPTIRQVKAHNATYLAICPDKSAASVGSP